MRIAKDFPAITEPSQVFGLLKAYGKKRQEHFLVVTLDGARRPINVHLATIGIANRCLVHPREIFYPAIKDNACAIIIAHNHPSGVVDPSSEDIAITKRLRDSGELLGISVLDHVIIEADSYASFAELGLLS